MAIIELSSVSKIYGFGDATTVALDNISLNVEKGEFIAIMGPSGSGKTTLMNIIGLLDRPTHGSYSLDSSELARLSDRKRAKFRRDKVGFVFQSFNLLPNLTAIENVALPLAYRGMGHTRRLTRASEMLDRVGLKAREYYYPAQLSGGQAQRTSVARALVNRPSLILADEPTGNLDTTASKAVMNLLREVHQGGNTIIMVTHNPELTRYASRIIYMVDGRIEHDQPLGLNQAVDLDSIDAAQSQTIDTISVLAAETEETVTPKKKRTRQKTVASTPKKPRKKTAQKSKDKKSSSPPKKALKKPGAQRSSTKTKSRKISS